MSEQMEQIGAAAVCASVRETIRANTSSWGDAGRMRGRYRHDEVCEQTERGAMWVVARACVCSSTFFGQRAVGEGRVWLWTRCVRVLVRVRCERRDE